MKVALHTLGCKQNYAESSHIRQQFEAEGHEIVDIHQTADMVVINTCTVTENADTECRKLIRRFLRTSPSAFVAVTGCYAQLQPEEIASIEGVDAVFGAKQKFAMPELIKEWRKQDQAMIFVDDLEAVEFVPATFAENDSHTRAFLKIQDGCDYNCSFCTIPLARGRSRSMPFDEIEPRVRSLSNQGFLEAVLTGINLGEYRSVNGEELYDVLAMLDRTCQQLRVRLSSVEVNRIKQSMIDLIAQSSVLCKHFHIPLQSGCDAILAKMKRRYTTAMYNDVLQRIREQMPHAGIGADVICGFPGETEEMFEQTVAFIEQSTINYLHVFSYSQRENTPAAEAEEQVPMNIRRQRTRRLRLLSEQKKRSFYRSQSSRTAIVICEGFDALTSVSNGYTDNYVRVQYPQQAQVLEERSEVLLGELRGDFVQARILHPSALGENVATARYIPLALQQCS